MLSLFFVWLSAYAHASPCPELTGTAEARAYQKRAAEVANDPAEPRDQLIYVGVSRAQWLELLNEGEIHGRRWGRVPMSAFAVADRPALESFVARNEGVIVETLDERSQFGMARDEAWTRTVIERLEARYPKIRTPGFYGFLRHLRITLESKGVTSPTIRQITEATTWGDLPKGAVVRNRELRTLVDLLDIPWGGRGSAQVGQRHRLIMNAFRDLPTEAGVVLGLGEGALRKILWHESGLAELVRIELGDVVAMEVFTDEDLSLVEQL